MGQSFVPSLNIFWSGVRARPLKCSLVVNATEVGCLHQLSAAQGVWKRCSSVVTPTDERGNISHGRTPRMDIRALVMFLVVPVSLLMLFVCTTLEPPELFGQLEGRPLLWRVISARARCMA
jgi:hypothetical protein